MDGIVTAPLDKAALLAGGYRYPGHTEMLATLTGRRVAMMLAATRPAPGLGESAARRAGDDALCRSATCQPRSRARRSSTRRDVTRAGLQDWFGIDEPRIALCALNPHAGDGGRFGREDDELLRPAAAEAGIAGPFPADTVFVRAMRGAFDAVIAPYHDVGMTAIKVASFGGAVNVTLGLPFPRTLARSRHGARHRGAGHRRSVEHDRGDSALRPDRATHRRRAQCEAAGMITSIRRAPAARRLIRMRSARRRVAAFARRNGRGRRLRASSAPSPCRPIPTTSSRASFAKAPSDSHVDADLEYLLDVIGPRLVRQPGDAPRQRMDAGEVSRVRHGPERSRGVGRLASAGRAAR